jgi:copper(I)-binding protein
VVCLIAALGLLPAAGKTEEVAVRNAWIREAPPGATMMAGYLELRNSTSRQQVLVAASSSGFESVTMHRTVVRGGMAGMERLPQIELATNVGLIFAPGGNHLMLMNPKQALRAGDVVVVKLEFQGGLVLPVTFAVRK